MSRLVIHRKAAKYLSSLPRPLKERIKETLTQLAEDPFSDPNVIQMTGNWAGYYRVRVADFRLVFWYDIENDTVYVDHIGNRGDVYRN